MCVLAKPDGMSLGPSLSFGNICMWSSLLLFCLIFWLDIQRIFRTGHLHPQPRVRVQYNLHLNQLSLMIFLFLIAL